MAIENKDLATIKKPNTVEYVSKEQLIERLKEIKRCREDITYFAENYYRIQSLDKPLHVVKLYDVQKDLLNFIKDNNRAIICSSRQLGKSTSYCIYVLWLTCFHRDKRCMLLAQKESTALELLDRIRIGYEYLPTWLKPGARELNKSSIKFTNGSTIMGFSSSAQGVRGQSCNCVRKDTEITIKKNNEIEKIAISTLKNNGIKHVSVYDDNKYTEIYKLDGVEVLSQNGTWERITSLNITPVQDLYEIRTKDYKLICAKDHILINSTGNEITAINSYNKYIKTVNGNQQVISVSTLDLQEELYDLSLDGETHTYFTNEILSHNCLILDEFAFINPTICSQLFESVYPTVSSSKNGKVIIVSTPNGKHNLYYDLWQKAGDVNNPENVDGWRRFLMHWSQVPGRDEKWKQATIAAIGKVRFAQEFDNQFLDDATTTRLITDDVTDKFRQQINEFKIRKINQGKNLFVKSTDSQKTFIFTMYHDFDPTRTYLATADVAEGVGKDSSVLYIWDVTDTSNITMCLKFSDNRTSVLDFAFVANEILKLYANPFLACESNGISLGFIDQLSQTYEYQNIVMMGKDGGPGIDSHYKLKTNACLWTRDMMTTEGFGFEIYDEELLDEFPTFIKKDGIQNTIYSAIRGSHDDHIMPLIWGCWILHPDNVQKYFNVVETFQTSTGVLYPKTLEPYEPYTPAEIQEIQEMELVKSFQFYKTKNNNEFLKAHQEKVEERRTNIKGVASEDDVNNRNLQEIAQKSVLSEDDMIALMRQQTMKEYHQKTQKLNIDLRNPQNRQQEQTYGKSRFFGVWDGNISNQMSPNEFNTFWKTQNPKRDAFDVMFGFDDPDDDGLVW